MSSHKFSLVAILVAFLIFPAVEVQAQGVPVTPQQLVRSLPAPIPVEVRPFATGAADPHSPLPRIRSQSQLNCINKQLRELQKVADAAGGNDSLQRQMARIPVVFEILNNDTTSGKPSVLRPGISRGLEPNKLI